MEYLIRLLKYWSEEGMRLPMAYNAESEGPSVTLLFVWLSGIITIISIAALFFTDSALTAACMSMSFWALSMVFYRIRAIDRFKVDLDDKFIELRGGKK